VQEAPARPDHADGTPGRHRYLLPLSARTEKALEEQAKRYVEFLSGDAPAWRDVCHTASQRRDHHDCRLAVLAGSKQRAVELLRALAGGELRPGVFRGRKPFGRGLKTALVYGSEAVAWQPHLVEIAAIVAGASLDLEEIDAALRRAAGATLAMVLNEKDRWSDPAFARPALVALQLVLTAWWRGVGVAPEVVVGRGVGELAAAWAARMLTAEEALRIAAAGSGRELAAVLDKLESRPASLPFLSGADGRLHRGADASHWQLCLDSCDGWSAALAALRSRNVDLCLEVGPGFLANPSAPGGKQSDGLGLIVPSFSPGEGDLLAAVGALCAAGADVVWQRVGPAQGRCVRLPGYPWQRQRLWPAVKNWLTQPLRDTADESSKSSAAPAREPLADGVAPQPRSRPELTVPYVPPRTPIEQQIADSWSALLGIDRIGVHDNFFELGGDSLQATILLNRLREELNEAIPAEVLFQVQTIADLASYLEEHYPAASAIPQLARDDRSQELLDRLDELTDDQVESLLSEAAVEGEASHE